MKIEKKLNLEDGSLALLQIYFDIREEKIKVKQNTPDLTLPKKSQFLAHGYV